MTSGGRPDRAVSDPAGLITGLVAAAEPRLEPEQIRAVITGVAGGRAKSGRLRERGRVKAGLARF